MKNKHGFVDPQVAAQIAGTADYRQVGEADHPITREEHGLAVEVGREIATKHGLNLDEFIANQEKYEGR